MQLILSPEPISSAVSARWLAISSAERPALSRLRTSFPIQVVFPSDGSTKPSQPRTRPALRRRWAAVAASSLLAVQGYEDGYTPLHMAVLKGKMMMCELLIEARADLTVVSSTGATPAKLAQEAGYSALASVLGA